MNDPFDIRIRSFVVELLDDPPEPPPFPDPHAPVIEADGGRPVSRSARRQPGGHGRRRGPLTAGVAFAAVLVVAGAAAMLSRMGERSDVDAGSGVEAVVGRVATVVDGVSFSRPQSIAFGEDGSYRVVDNGRIVNTGSYTTRDLSVEFVTDPTDEVTWVDNPVFLRVTDPCSGVVGRYRVVFESATRFRLDVISDACGPRVGVANGLVLEIATG